MADKKILSQMSGDDFIGHWVQSHRDGVSFPDFLATFVEEDSHIKATQREGAKSKDPQFYLRREVKSLAKVIRKELKGIGFNLPKLTGESARAKATRTMSKGKELKALALAFNLPKYTAEEKKEDKAAVDRALKAQAARK